MNVNLSRKVEYGWDFPSDGTTPVRRTAMIHSDGATATDVYNTGMDDNLSRLSGQKQGTTWLFQEQYLGLSRMVQRQYGATGVYWDNCGSITHRLGT